MAQNRFIMIFAAVLIMEDARFKFDKHNLASHDIVSPIKALVENYSVSAKT